MATPQTLTLTEFLLARIAEDERLARDAESVWQVIGRNPKPFPGVAHNPDDWMKSEAFSLNINPWKILHECEAKRQIIAVCVGDDPDQGEMDPRFADERVPALVLRALALPYAAHPDYRDEWRPDGLPSGQYGPTADYGEG